MRDGEEVFVGRILAGMTHELLNVFATIGETAGLLDDLLARGGAPAHPGHDRAQRSLSRIRNQVTRGTEIGERLNRFAHSMDEPAARVEVDHIVEQMVFLMQRSAHLRRVTLCALPAQQSPVISTRPLQLQLALGACIDHCVASTGAGGAVTLQVRESDAAVSIVIEIDPHAAGADQGLVDEQLLAGLADCLAGMHASISPLQPRGRPGLELRLPHS
jgi:C4-dicarboxylate-specific signal transduction histidine kinase